MAKSQLLVTYVFILITMRGTTFIAGKMFDKEFKKSGLVEEVLVPLVCQTQLHSKVKGQVSRKFY